MSPTYKVLDNFQFSVHFFRGHFFTPVCFSNLHMMSNISPLSFTDTFIPFGILEFEIQKDCKMSLKIVFVKDNGTWKTTPLPLQQNKEQLILPQEVWILIWSFLDFKTLQKICIRVSKSWMEMIRSSKLSWEVKF